MLTRTSTQPLADQLAARFAERIRARLLAPGTRLPSVRECARQQGVSPYTVVAAYDQLLAQGLVEARKQRGFFVRDIVAVRPPPADRAAPRPTSLDGPIAPGARFNATALIRGMFHQPSPKPQPGSGVLPPDWLENGFMPAAVRKVTSGRALADGSLRYGEPLGA